MKDVQAAEQTQATREVQREIQAAVEAQAQKQEALETGKSDADAKTVQAPVKQVAVEIPVAATPAKSEKEESEVDDDDNKMDLPELDEASD